MWLLLPVLAHVGGVPTPAVLSTPDAPGEVADDAFVLRWTDDDADPTGKFDFYFQPENVKPVASFPSSAFVGVAIEGGQEIPISDAADELTWDTSAVAAGAYFVYGVTIDPPLQPIYRFADAPLVVQHAGDPRWPAVVVDEPDGIGDTVDAAFAIRWRAVADEPLVATLRAGDRLATDAPEELATAVPLVPGDDGAQHGCFTWDVSALARGYYYVQVEVADVAGRTHAAYGRSVVVVEHGDGAAARCGEMPVDAGLADAAVLAADAASAADAAPGTAADSSGCGCRVSNRRGAGGAWLLALALLLRAARRR